MLARSIRLHRYILHCRTLLTSRALFEKDCDANLKGPREGQSVGHSASDQRSYPSVWGRLNVLEARARREAQLYLHCILGTKIEYAFHQTFSAYDKEAGHETTANWPRFSH